MSFMPKRSVEVEEPKEKKVEESPDHQCVTRFAELMKGELDENRRLKSGRESWLKVRPMDHVLQVYYHCGKLQVALKTLELLKENKDSSRHEIQYQESQVAEYAADVGNHAMMVLDTLRMLGVPVPKPKKDEKPVREYSTWS